MDNFDLKKFLTENKLTSVTRLAEKAHPTFLQGDVNKAHSTLGPKLETHLLNFGHDIPLNNTQAVEKFLYGIIKSLKTFALDLPRNPEVTPQAFGKFKDILTRFQDYKIGPEAAYEIVTLLLSKDTYEDPTTASLKGFGQAVAGTQRENKLTSITRLSETADVPRQALAELLKVLEQNEAMSNSPEEGDWRQDPTHVLEMGIEILEKYGVQVPDGMFSDRLYDRVVSMAARPDNEYDDDLPGIADDILTLLQDPNMYNRHRRTT